MPHQPRSLVITVADEAMPGIHDVARHLGQTGLEVARVMPLTGVITGRFAGTELAVLKAVAGVASVEEELGMQLPPGDSPVQ